MKTRQVTDCSVPESSRAFVAFFALSLGLASSLSHGAECVVEEDEIVLAGRLSRETFAGPPNYESVHKGDRAETHWILTVPEPVTFCPFTDANGRPHTIGSVNRFQLVVDEEQPGLKQALIARYAIVRGRIVVAHGDHHNAAALIEVTQLRPG